MLDTSSTYVRGEENLGVCQSVSQSRPAVVSCAEFTTFSAFYLSWLLQKRRRYSVTAPL